MANSNEKNAYESDERYHRVADYLNGHLTPQERLAFEEEIRQDSDLKQLLDFQQALAATVRRRERDALKERLKQLRVDDSFDLGRTGTYSLSKSASGASRPNARSRLSIAAVITLLLVSGAAIYFLTTKSGNDEKSVAVTQDTVTKTVADISTAPDTSRQQSVKPATPASNRKSSPVLLSVSTVELSTLPMVDDRGFGFASTTKIRVLVYEEIDSVQGELSEKRGFYELTKNELRLFVGQPIVFELYYLGAEEVSELKLRLDDESKKIAAGYYLYLNDVLCPLIADGSRHKLVPVDTDIQRILFSTN